MREAGTDLSGFMALSGSNRGQLRFPAAARENWPQVRRNARIAPRVARQQVCTAIKSAVVLSLDPRLLADHFGPSPHGRLRGAVRGGAGLIPAIRAGRAVHEFTWSDSRGAEPGRRIGRGGFDHHRRACLRPET